MTELEAPEVELDDEMRQEFIQDWNVAKAWAIELIKQAINHETVTPRQAILGTLIGFFGMCHASELDEEQIEALFRLVGSARHSVTEH